MTLNYHHLYYFFIIAREGSITKASKILNLAPQTISGQLSQFEDYLNNNLFDRVGKRLILNDFGNFVYSYAQDIFALGSELQQQLRAQDINHQVSFAVGVVDAVPKVLTYMLLKSCFDVEAPIRLICREGDLESLLADIAINKLDLIISDQPLTSNSAVKAYNHLLGETGITFYTDKQRAKQLTDDFPYSLHQQPFLICGDKSTQKISLASWFESLEISPRIVAEFDDSALLKFFGQGGVGVFCTPSSIEDHVLDRYNVSVIGRTDEITERYYAISPERKLKHPGVMQVVAAAKSFMQ